MARHNRERLGDPRPATAKAWFCLVAFAVLAGFLVVLVTRDGVETSPDSSVYVGTASSVAAGHGLSVPFHFYPLGKVSIGTPPPGQSTPSPTPLVIYAPLAPVLLSVGGHPIGSARVEDAIFLALTVLLAGLFVLEETGDLFLTSAAQLVLTFSLLFSVTDAGTTAVALFFTVLALFAIVRHLRKPSAWWLVLASVSVGIATLERFAAGGLIVWGVIVLRRRMRDALAYLVMSSLAVGGWFLYEQVSGRSTGHFLGIHVELHVRDGVRSIADWVLPSNAPSSVAFLVAVALIVIVGILTWRSQSRVPRLLVGYAIVQIAILEIATTFFDAGVNLDPVEFIPIFLAIVLAVACSVTRTTAVTLVGSVVVAAFVLAGTVNLVSNPQRGYAETKWTHSPIMAAVSALPKTAVIYTNAADAVYLLDHRATSSVPEVYDFSTLKHNDEYDSQLQEITKTLMGRSGYVVYVRGLNRPFLPTESELQRQLHLVLVRNAPDGAIYRIS